MAGFQSYVTPREFLEAVEARFCRQLGGSIRFDLAATLENARTPHYFTREMNALAQSWHTLMVNRDDLLWCNPPYGDKECPLSSWAAKCLEESRKGARIALLCPLSMSVWYRNFLHHRATVYGLQPRIPFEGMDNGIRQDLCLAIFGPIYPREGDTTPNFFNLWNWKEDLVW